MHARQQPRSALRSSGRVAFATAALLLVTAPLAALAGSLPASAATPTATWVSQTIPPPTSTTPSQSGYMLQGISCPSATDCVAVGSTYAPAPSGGSGVMITGAEVLLSTNGGQAWATGTAPSGASLTAVACPTSTTCFAAGNTTGTNSMPVPIAAVSTDAGQSWTLQSLPASSSSSTSEVQLRSISCATATACVAVGFVLAPSSTGTMSESPAIYSTSDGGSTWSAEPAPSAASGIGVNSVACTSTAACVAVGDNSMVAYPGSGTTQVAEILTTSDGGSTWAAQQATSESMLASVACPSASTCYAAGVPSASSSAVLVTTDGGSTWSPTSGSPQAENAVIACPTTSECVAANNTQAASATVDGGTSWGSQSLPAPASSTTQPPPPVSGLACPTTADCFAAGGMPPMPASGSFPGQNGSVFMDATTNEGTVSTPPPATPSSYTPLTPARLVDTRCVASPAPSYCAGENLPAANAGVGPLAALSTENVTVTGVGNVPATGVTAVVLNVTYAGSSAPGGYLSVFPAGSARPTTSILNWQSSNFQGAIPNLVTVAVPSSGQVSIYNGSGGTTNLTVDVEGYYSAASSTPSVAGTYNPITPARLVDTRCAASPAPSYCAGENLPAANAGVGPLAAQATANVTVTGVGGVPASGVAAVVLNVTVTGDAAGGYLSVWPEGQPRATVSNLNWSPGETVPNRVVVPVSSTGQISLYNGSSSSLDVIVDVGGWIASSTSSTMGDLFVPVVPTRICDTRPGNPSGLSGGAAQCGGQTLQSGSTLVVQVAGVAGLPSSGVAAVVANVTVVGPTSGGYLTVWPGGSVPRPATSDLNWPPGDTVANLVLTGLASNGSMSVYNQAGSTNVLVDVVGYYTAG
ncbi:MAG: hypothetical protein M0035_11125 [Actinomycetota bacterium]|nr:hypothetical protein [Actinomycetota bacterium]